MIFTAIGLLVVALVMLVAGIVRSSTALLTLSVLATLVACVTLLASYRYYRTRAAAEAGADLAPAGWPAAYRAAGPEADGGTSAVANGRARALPVDGWDRLAAGDAVRLVASLNLDELHAARRHEVEHDRRTEVLRAIDLRTDLIVDLRRSVSSTG